MRIFSIILFGNVGVILRYYLGIIALRNFPPNFPYGTFIINLTGAFLIGVVYVLGIERALFSPELRMAIMVGFLGGYTTFSSYCLEVTRLIQSGNYLIAGLYFFLSPILGVFFVILGAFLTRLIVVNF